MIIAQTRIKALESEIKRKEETCKIQEERIKSLEHPAVNNLLNHYLTQMEPNAVPPSSDSTCSCSCSSAITEITSELAYIKGQIASLGQCPPLPESTIHNQNPQNLDGIVEVVDLTQQDTATDTPAVDQKSKKMFFPQMISEEMIKENPEHKSFIIKGRVVAEHQTIDLETKKPPTIRRNQLLQFSLGCLVQFGRIMHLLLQ